MLLVTVHDLATLSARKEPRSGSSRPVAYDGCGGEVGLCQNNDLVCHRQSKNDDVQVAVVQRVPGTDGGGNPPGFGRRRRAGFCSDNEFWNECHFLSPF